MKFIINWRLLRVELNKIYNEILKRYNKLRNKQHTITKTEWNEMCILTKLLDVLENEQ